MGWKIEPTSNQHRTNIEPRSKQDRNQTDIEPTSKQDRTNIEIEPRPNQDHNNIKTTSKQDRTTVDLPFVVIAGADKFGGTRFTGATGVTENHVVQIVRETLAGRRTHQRGQEGFLNVVHCFQFILNRLGGDWRESREPSRGVRVLLC